MVYGYLDTFVTTIILISVLPGGMVYGYFGYKQREMAHSIYFIYQRVMASSEPHEGDMTPHPPHPPKKKRVRERERERERERGRERGGERERERERERGGRERIVDQLSLSPKPLADSVQLKVVAGGNRARDHHNNHPSQKLVWRAGYIWGPQRLDSMTCRSRTLDKFKWSGSDRAVKRFLWTACNTPPRRTH